MDRGDIYIVDLNSTTGREQQGKRPVIVVTTREFNQHNPPIVCPITSGGAAARYGGFTVPLATSGLKTDGVVLCSQPRTLDLKARGGKLVEHAPDEITESVMAALQDIFE